MVCKKCASNNQRTFGSEVAIHVSGLKGLNKPIVWVFPQIVVCCQCGFTEFTVPEEELAVLMGSKPAPGVVVLMGDREQNKGIAG